MPHPQIIDWFSEPPTIVNAVVRRSGPGLRVDGATLDRASGVIDAAARVNGVTEIVTDAGGVFAVRGGQRVARLHPERVDLSRL